ncbi:MAG: orotidine-5'-phosphate decarboxylase [Armatimonadota bacterium]|jgi:orotidine-5'-phosphate decarboxylase
MTTAANFADRLLEAAETKQTSVVVGLDPRLGQIPSHLQDAARQSVGADARGVAHCFLEFNRRIIDAVADSAVAVKPQIAFYEPYGAPGVECFIETIRHARQAGLLVIADAKRNDIGSTAEAYADAFLGSTSLWDGAEHSAFDADAITVNGYLGSDGVRPFVEAAKANGKGLFVLVKTSNESSGELQDLHVQGGEGGEPETVFGRLGRMVKQWGAEVVGEAGYSSVGAVVGATFPEQGRALRQMLPGVPFLVPGYGAQGATAADVACSFDADGLGAVVNSSRGIIFAYQQDEYCDRYGEARFADAAAAAAAGMRDEINEALASR